MVDIGNFSSTSFENFDINLVQKEVDGGSASVDQIVEAIGKIPNAFHLVLEQPSANKWGVLIFSRTCSLLLTKPYSVLIFMSEYSFSHKGDHICPRQKNSSNRCAMI